MVLVKRLHKSLLLAVSGLPLWMLWGCQGLTNSTTTPPTSPPPPPATINSIKHIIFMAQENRSLDTYFGQLPAYWAANGYPQASGQFNGLPTNASNPAYNGTTTPGTTTVPAYHIATECIDNLTPSWDESHEDWNLQSPASSTPLNNGFVYNGAVFAIAEGYPDIQGYRAMGYYDWTDLPFYYFMASNFATSDNWFSPALDRTQVNRMYLMAATSQGYAYPPGTDAADNAPLTATTIFDELTAAGISWKIYATDYNLDPTNHGTYLTQFAKYAPPNPLPANVVPGTDFLTDIQNDATFPSVAFIEGGYLSGRDEHPDNNVQSGASYVASLINGFMASPSWSDSVFILTYDEAGGTYDHVAPVAAVNPDGIAPVDLLPGDICTSGGSNCDFNYTGFRVPMIVISPFTKKNYVDHTAADYTAILKFIETRFSLQPLTQRDAAQMDMTEFFDFQNVPWATPPANVPSQPTNGTCDVTDLGYPTNP
ncbi:MAG TPA: alkaline phosphatase family protein [Terriglobales bacterium]|nr:alkaline phosphatase family protein [Terriglobales bacterium]